MTNCPDIDSDAEPQYSHMDINVAVICHKQTFSLQFLHREYLHTDTIYLTQLPSLSFSVVISLDT